MAQVTWGSDPALTQTPVLEWKFTQDSPRTKTEHPSKPETWISHREGVMHYSAESNEQTFQHTWKERRDEGLKPQRAKGLKLQAGSKVCGRLSGL